MTGLGDVAEQGAWSQAAGSAPAFIAGPAPSIFGTALNAGTSASQTVINHFSVATGSTDSLHFQASDWTNGGTNNLGGFNVGLTDIGIAAVIAAGDPVTPETITTSGQAFVPGANLVEISGVNTFTGAAQLASTLQTSFDLKFGGLFTTNNVHFLVGYSDGTNIHIADLDVYNKSAATVADSNAVGANIYVSDVVQLTGVNSFASLNAHLGHFA